MSRVLPFIDETNLELYFSIELLSFTVYSIGDLTWHCKCELV